MKGVPFALLAGLALAACQPEAGTDGDAAPAGAPGEIAAEEAPVEAAASDHPPLGRYVCRQSLTTIGWIDLTEDRYAVGEVAGGYDYDAATGAIEWQGGAYAGWPARYEFSPAGEGHAQDEYIIRMTDETDSLRIDCFLTSD